MSNAAALERLEILEPLTRSMGSEQETFTLVSTLPALGRQSGATAAAPARREVSTRRWCADSSSDSACLRAVISFETPKVPMTRPSLSRQGILVEMHQVTLPSACGVRSTLPMIGSLVLM